MERREFRAMGTEIELMLDVPSGPAADYAFAEAKREFDRIEAALSRFLPDSELSALNRRGWWRSWVSWVMPAITFPVSKESGRKQR